jgi:hypothetical protein
VAKPAAHFVTAVGRGVEALCAVTHPSPHVGSKVIVLSKTGARDELLASRGPAAVQAREAHAAVEPDPAFVERLHAQLDDAISRHYLHSWRGGDTDLANLVHR